MRIWADEHANLERRRLEVQEASVHPVALRDLIDRLAEHLHRLDLALLLELREVNLHPHPHRAGEHGAGEHLGWGLQVRVGVRVCAALLDPRSGRCC